MQISALSKEEFSAGSLFFLRTCRSVLPLSWAVQLSFFHCLTPAPLPPPQKKPQNTKMDLISSLSVYFVLKSAKYRCGFSIKYCKILHP